MIEQNVNGEFNVNVILRVNISHDNDLDTAIKKMEQIPEVNFAEFIDYE